MSITGTYVSSQSIPGLYEKPCATSHALYLIILFFSFRLRSNTHLYPTSITPLGVWITGPKMSCLLSEFNSA